MARKLVVEIVGDSRSLEKAFTRSSRASRDFGRDVSRAARGGVVATVGFRGLGRSVAFASASFLGGAGFVAGARKALDAASDLGEEINKSNVLFGRNASEVQAWARTTATAIGLSQRAALQAAGNFAAMFETLRLGDAVSSRMSRQLVQLGADLASFSNQDPEDMLDRLRSGLAGEAEPLRRFGILLSEARVQQEAYASGLAKSGAKLTEQQKVQARFNLILKDSAAAQGDFARTSTSQANQERINAALREQAAQRIGQVLLPAYNKATRAVNKWLGDERNLAKLQRGTAQALDIATSAAKAFVSVVKTLAPILQTINKTLGGTQNTVKLLLAAFAAAKILSFGRALTGLNAQLLTSTTRAAALRGALLRLGALSVITIGIEFFIHRKAINDAGIQLQKAINDKLGFSAIGDQTTLNVLGKSVQDLEKARAKLAEFKGEGDLAVRALDVVIARMRVMSRQDFRKAETSFEKLRKKVASLPDKKKIDVESTLKGIDKVQGELAKVKDKTVEVKAFESGLRDISTRLGQVKGKTVEVAFVESGLAAIQAELDRLSGRTIEVSVTATEKSARASAVATSGTSLADSIDKLLVDTRKNLDRLVKAARASKAQARRVFDDLMESLDRAGVRAGATLGQSDDLRILQQRLAAVQAEIRVEGKTKELLDLEADISAEIVTTTRDIADNARSEAQAAKDRARAAREAAQAREVAARQAAAANRKVQQFTALGLTGEGQERVPGRPALQKRLTSLREQIKGTVLDTEKTRTQLDRIAKVLTGKFGKVGRDVRSAILQMFQDIAGALDQGDKQGPLTKTTSIRSKKLLEGIGLSPEEIRELRGRLSNFNTSGVGLAGSRNRPSGGGFAGGSGFVIENNVTVAIDGQKFSAVVTKQQQKQKRRNPKQKRGPNRHR